MDASLFIARKKKFKGQLAMWCIALSFLVMIIAVVVASGFRTEIRRALSTSAGDILIQPLDMSMEGVSARLNADPAYLDEVLAIEGVESVRPVVYKGAIVKHEGLVQGIVLKGVEGFNVDSTSLNVALPSRLASMMNLGPGDRMLTYFIGDPVKVRRFKVDSIYSSALENEDFLVVRADIEDLRRLDGPQGGQTVSAFEVQVSPEYLSRDALEEKTSEVATALVLHSADEDETALASSLYARFPQVMDWLDLIDFNVLFILGLMVVVASFNMISGLLIILFENIPTIGLLKALGMRTRGIVRIFFYGSGSIVLKGMLIGNLIAVVLCLIQQHTGVLTLDPTNYFVSEIPVHLDFGLLLLCDAVAGAVIMVVQLLPSLFISRVDPAKTMRIN